MSTDPPSPSPSPRARRRRARSIGSWVLGLSLAGAAAVAPALGEAAVQQRLRERLGVDEAVGIALDLGGLELRAIDRSLPGDRGHVRADRIRVRPGVDGVHVEIDGLEALLTRARPKPAAPRSPAPQPREPQAREPERPTMAPADPLAAMLLRLRGVPIHVEVRGRVQVELAEGLLAAVDDPTLELPGDGRILGQGRFQLGNGEGPAWVRATLELAALDENPRAIQLAGNVDLDLPGSPEGRVGDDLHVAGRVDPAGADIYLRERGGGQAQLKVARLREDGQTREHVDVDADDLPLALLEPLANLLGTRVSDGLGDKIAVDFAAARMDGHVELERSPGLTRARFDQVELRELVVVSELIAARPLALGPLSIDGEVNRSRRAASSPPRTSGELVVTHGGLQARVGGTLDEVGVRFELEIPEGPCQQLIDAVPAGAAPLLAGTAVQGELAVHLGLALDFADLAAARERYLVDGDLELPDSEDFEAPGTLQFDFPFLEACTVERLGPGVDVAGLRGVYHHDFVSGGGRDQRRVLASGDSNFVPIAEIPKLALAFVILEDARFWQHDGFDREQIERAFWFNLLEGRVRRGASTISQQTARSLWLGIDRSLSRKLAEALLAAELEREVDKTRILEVYLNVIELGPEIHGVVEAARYHFGKDPRDLDLREALHLASLAPAPVAYSRRFASGETDRAWREHLHQQVRRLRIRHLISRGEANEAMRDRLQLRPHPELLERPR